jgi:hypothetical protein
VQDTLCSIVLRIRVIDKQRLELGLGGGGRGQSRRGQSRRDCPQMLRVLVALENVHQSAIYDKSDAVHVSQLGHRGLQECMHWQV